MMKNAAESIHTSAVKIRIAPQTGNTFLVSFGSHSVRDGMASMPMNAKPAPIHA